MQCVGNRWRALASIADFSQALELRQDMKPTHAALCAGAFALCLTGCMMRPVRQEVPSLGNDLSARAASPATAKLVLVNNSGKLLHGADNTGRINVRIDGKAVGGPNIGEYVQVEVPKGKHQLEVWHLDLIKFATKQEVFVDQDLVIELKATPFSNRILVQTTMPAGDFHPMVVASDAPEERTLFGRSTAAVSSYWRSLR